MARTGKVQGWIAGGVAGALVIAAAGWFLLISPQFDEKADADQRVADAQTQNIVLQKRLDSLRDRASRTDELKDQLAQLYAAVPGDHDIEGFTRQLTDFAAAAGVSITSISPASPTQVTLPDSTGASNAAPAVETPGDTTTPAPEDSSAPTAPTTDAGPAGHLYAITVTVVTTGPMAAQRAFLAAIETQGVRRALVTGTSFAPIVDAVAAPADAPSGNTPGAAPTGNDSGDRPDAATATATTEPPPPPPPSATDGQWTLTTELSVFVAPQSPGQESQLLDQLGGNG